MEKGYLFVALMIAIVISAFIAYHIYGKRLLGDNEIYQATLLYFDGECWYSSINYGSYFGRGLVYLPEKGHYVGEKLTVRFRASGFMESFEEI